MKISTCIIAKDEEEVIERLLKCIVKFSDEIIFVDTGSVDSTIEIAKRFTNNIYSFKWENDFSKARNFAFSKATCEYVAWFDADDYITEENIEKINEIKRLPSPKDTYMFKYSCGFDANNKPTITFYRERLMRKCAFAKFIGAVHEVVVPFGFVEYVDVEVEHRKIKSADPKRNLNIYRQMVKRSALSTRDVFYFAKEYYYNGYYKSAFKMLNAFVKRQDAYLPDLKDAYITLYDCSLKIGKEKPSKYLLKCMEKCEIDSEILCKLGDEYYRLNESNKSIDFYKIALCFEKDNVKTGFVRNEFYHIYPLLQLVKICYDVGRKDESLLYHQKCIEKYPYDSRVVYNESFFKNVVKLKNL